jgi:hypothetical protein
MIVSCRQTRDKLQKLLKNCATRPLFLKKACRSINSFQDPNLPRSHVFLNSLAPIKRARWKRNRKQAFALQMLFAAKKLYMTTAPEYAVFC